MTKFFVRQGTQLGEDLISFRLNTESVWKQENYKILWSMQKRHSRGAPNDLRYGRGVTDFGKCLETGKLQNPLVDAKTSLTRGSNDLRYGRGVTEFGKLLETGK